jgi:hypothetical protein
VVDYPLQCGFVICYGGYSCTYFTNENTHCRFHSTDKIYFASSDPPEHVPINCPWIPHINESSLVYTAFFADFGPLDLGLTYRFCNQFHEKLSQGSQQRKAVVYFASDEPQKRANCATLLMAYLVSSLASLIRSLKNLLFDRVMYRFSC